MKICQGTWCLWLFGVSYHPSINFNNFGYYRVWREEEKTLDSIKTIQNNLSIYAGHVARMGEMRNAYYILVENNKGRRLLRITLCRGENKVNTDLEESKCEDVHTWLRTGSSGVSWEHNNFTSSIQGRKFLNFRHKNHIPMVHPPLLSFNFLD